MIPLRTSHVAFYAAVVTLTFTLALAFGFWFIRRQMLTGNDFLLNAESQSVLARIAQIPPPVDAGKLEAALKEHTSTEESLFYFQVHEPAGKVVYHSPNLGAAGLTDLTGGLDKRTLDLPPLGLLRVAEYHTPTVHLQIAMSLRNFQSVNDTFVRVFLVGIPLIAVLSVAFGTVLRDSTLRPVRLMQATARRISASNLSERIVVPPGSGEMAALARLLNEMIDRLEKSFNHVKRFTADTSHELMTPLSVIRLHAEKLLNDPDFPPKHRHAVEEQLQETLHLAETLERLLTLAKADSTVLPLKLQPVAVHEFIGQFAEDAQLLAESRGLKLVVAQNDTGTATFDQGWMRQVLFNLLSNALRFSPPAGTITLHSQCAYHRWTAEVRDEGRGVPPGRLDEIFGRFVQITPRSEPGTGAGLGLAICKSIVELHKGQISAANRMDRSGLVVAFSLPLDGHNN
jgi:signal transduction histidine kinase